METLEQAKERQRREAERKRIYGQQSKAINNAVHSTTKKDK